MIEVTTIRYQCEHCGKMFDDPIKCREHEKKCMYDPKHKACATCINYKLVEKENVYTEYMLKDMYCKAYNIEHSNRRRNCKAWRSL